MKKYGITEGNMKIELRKGYFIRGMMRMSWVQSLNEFVRMSSSIRNESKWGEMQRKDKSGSGYCFQVIMILSDFVYK